MTEFVFIWTVKELVKSGLMIFFAAMVMSTLGLAVATGLETEESSDREAWNFMKGSAFISISAEVVCLLVVYVARLFYWIVAIW